MSTSILIMELNNHKKLKIEAKDDRLFRTLHAQDLLEITFFVLISDDKVACQVDLAGKISS